MPSQLITSESSAANQRSDSLYLQDSSIVASREQKPSCDLNRDYYLNVSQHSHAIVSSVAIASPLPSPKRATAKKGTILHGARWLQLCLLFWNIIKLHPGGQSLAKRRLVRTRDNLPCQQHWWQCILLWPEDEYSYLLQALEHWFQAYWPLSAYRKTSLPTRKYTTSRLGLATACHNSLKHTKANKFLLTVKLEKPLQKLTRGKAAERLAFSCSLGSKEKSLN